MAYRKRDWYQHLIDQSLTDHIYDLIHGYLPHNWEPNHGLDLVVLRTGGLAAVTGQQAPAAHISRRLDKSGYSFPAGDYILLDDEHLTDYLELAKRMAITEDLDGREYIELLFTREAQEARPAPGDEATAAAAWDMAPDKDGAIFAAYERLKVPCEKEEAYKYAKLAETFLDEKRVPIVDNIDASLFEAKRILFGYNVVAMVYAWNDKMDDAAMVDSYYMLYPHVWNDLEGQIHAYLGLLMAKKQRDYLDYLFSDKAFRQRFPAHYEAYMSLLVNDRYPLTRMGEVISIINQVNNVYKAYL